MNLRLPRRVAIVALAGLSLLHLLFIAPALGSAEPHGMDLSIHMGETAQFARALSAGDTGLWNPSGNCGYAMAWYYQSLPQLVPALLHLATGGALPLLKAFQWSLAIPIVLFPVAVYRALRLGGRDRAEALAGALAAGVVRAAVPWRGWGLEAEAAWAKGVAPQVWAMAAYPLAVAWGWRTVRTGRGWGWAALWGTATGVAHPMVGVALLPALAVLPWWRGGAWRPAARAAALCALALAASAFFWAPILLYRDDFGGFPIRGASERGIGLWTFVKTLATGGLLDNGRFPVLTLALVAAIATAALRCRRAPVWLLAQGGAFAALVVGGTVLPRLPGDILPPTRFLAPLQLSLACAAGIGVVSAVRALAARGAARRTPALPRLAALAAAAGALLLVVDHLGSSSRRVLTSRDLPGAHRDELTAVFDTLAARPPGRFLTGDAPALDNHWAMYLPFVYAGTPAIRANGAAPVQSSPNFRAIVHVPARRLVAARLGARYLLSGNAEPDAIPGAVLICTTPTFSLFELPGASPWYGRQSGITEESEGPSRYAARVTVYAAVPDRVRLAVTRHTGWHATVDGREVPILPEDPHLMAIDVPPGEHTVEFRFRRPAWTWGLAALSPLVLAAAFFIRPPRRVPA